MTDGRTPAHGLMAELATGLGAPDLDVARVSIEQTPTALATAFPIADMAAAAHGLVGLAAASLHQARGGAAQTVSVDRRAASLSMTCAAYLTVDAAPVVTWDPLTRYFRSSDGWVYLHCQFPHLRERLLEAFDLPGDAEAVATHLATLTGQEIEDRAARAGACAIKRRARAEWEAHAHAHALAQMPLVSCERVSDAARKPLGPDTAPLAGVRVLDLTRVIAGPIIGRTLADFGAEVIRISSPHLPFIESLVINSGFGKRAAHVDLETAEGRDALAALVREADVLIDGYRPGALAGKGFGAHDLAALNPGLVTVTLSAFGETGPWGGRRGYDTYVQGAVGLSADGPDGPSRLPCQPLDYLTGYLGAAAAMTALRRRMTEGGGWRSELALARTAQWLWEVTDRLGTEDAPPAKNPAPEDVTDLMIEMSSDFGLVRALAPVVRLSDTPPEWRSPPVRLGTHAPRWMAA